MNILQQFTGLWKQLLALQEQERQIHAELQTLRTEADAAIRQAERRARSKTDDLDSQIREIQVYYDEARRYQPNSKFCYEEQQYQQAELQQLYTLLSNSPQGLRCAEELLLKSDAMLRWLERCKREVLREQRKEADRKTCDATEGARAKALKQQLSAIERGYLNLIDSEQMAELYKEALARTGGFLIKSGATYKLDVPSKSVESFCLGFCWLPFPVDKRFTGRLKQRLGGFYDEAAAGVRLPVGFSGEKIGANGEYAAVKLRLLYNAQTERIAYSAITAFLFNILRSYPPLAGRVVYLDLNTWNPEFLGFMKKFCGAEAMISAPTGEQAAQRCLQKLEADVNGEPEDKRSRRFVIVRGDPFNAGSALGHVLARIANNGKKNNVMFFFADRQDKSSVGAFGTDTIRYSLTVEADGTQFFTAQYQKLFRQRSRFGFPMAPADLSEDTWKRFRDAYAPKPFDNCYESYFDLSAPIRYTRERRPLTLTYGIDNKGNPKSITFENTTFAGFLVGASGFGKSTAIHALLANLITHYHPDEVELWLADFKMETFSFYRKYCPPHVRYILLDNTREVVFDFLDKLHEELLRREKLLSTWQYEDRRDVPSDKYLPTIFLVIDEFSVLSDAVGDDEDYKRKLKDLFVKGRSNGFRILLASQIFTTGTTALRQIAKDSIGLRLAMGTKSPTEIKETLAIPSGQYTQQISDMIGNLAMYHVLQREEDRDGRVTVQDVMPFYFPGKGEAAWPSRYALFQRLNASMKKIRPEDYTGREINTFVDKNPVFVARGDLEAFGKDVFAAARQSFLMNSATSLVQGDFLLRLGVPRKMKADCMAVMTQASGENLFLLSTDQEVTCAMSVVLAAMRSAHMQRVKTEIWTDGSNRMRSKFDHVLQRLPYKEGGDAVRSAIFSLVDTVRAGDRSPRLIVLLGLPNLLTELEKSEDDDFFAPVQKNPQINQAALGADTDADRKRAALYAQITREQNQIADDTEEEGEAKGWTDDQIEQEISRRCAEHLKKKYGFASAANGTASAANGLATAAQSSPSQNDDRDAKEELQKLICNGGKFGCHFLVYLNSFRALNATGLNLKAFHHRVCFRTDTKDTALAVLESSGAYYLSEHIAYYRSFGTSAEGFPFVPYLHSGVCWDGWQVDSNGRAVSPIKKD